MFCSKCGQENKDDSKFCSGCGAPLSAPQPQVQPAPSPAAPVQPQAAPQAQQLTQPQPQAAPQAQQPAQPQPQATPQAQQLTQPQPQAAPVQKPKVVNTYPGDPQTIMECIGKSWYEMRTSRNWVGRVFLLALIAMVPVFNFVVFGYFYSLARHAGKKEEGSYPTNIVSADNFKLGAQVFLISVIFSAICSIFLLPAIFLFASYSIVFKASAGLLFILYLGVMVFLPLVTTLMCLRFAFIDFAAGWKLGEIFRVLGKNFKYCFCMIALTFLILSFATSIMFFLWYMIAEVAFKAALPYGGLLTTGFLNLPGFFDLMDVISRYENPLRVGLQLAYIAGAVLAWCSIMLVGSYCTMIVSCAGSQIITRAEGYFVAKYIPEWLTEQPKPKPQPAPAPAAPTVQPTSTTQPAPAAPTVQPTSTTQPAPVVPAAQPAPQPTPTPKPEAVPSTVVMEPVAPVAAPAPAAKPKAVRLTASPENVFVFDKFPSTIGKSAEANLSVQGLETLSGIHCTITMNDNGDILITDNNSTNGTTVNGNRIAVPTVLKTGDALSLGGLDITVELL